MTNIQHKKYDTYEQYKKHQASKLDTKVDKIRRKDKKYEVQIESRYKGRVHGGRLLCLGARLGGEVRGFKRLGEDAIGVDLNPGKDNPDVIQGDFHDLPFDDDEFDVLFTNSLDHVLELERFLIETQRVLKPGGIFIIEMMATKPRSFEVIDCSRPEEVMKRVYGYYDEVGCIVDVTNAHYNSGMGKAHFLTPLSIGGESADRNS